MGGERNDVSAGEGAGRARRGRARTTAIATPLVGVGTTKVIGQAAPAEPVRKRGKARPKADLIQDPAYRKRKEAQGYVYYQLNDGPNDPPRWHESMGGSLAKSLKLDHVIDDEEAAADAAALAKYGL